MICETCGKPAVERSMEGRDFLLCDSCWNRLRLQADFDYLAPTLIRLARQDLSKCLQIMAEFYEEHKSQDLDGSLARSVLQTRALFLIEHKRYEEARGELIASASEFTPYSPADRERRTSLALALEGTGRTVDALRQLEDILSNNFEMHPDEVMGIFYMYAQICRDHQMELPDRLSEQLSSAIDGVGLPVPEEVRKTSLVDAIFLAHQRRVEAQDRYVAMLEQLKHQPKERRREVLEWYIRHEPVDYFRKMALNALNNE